MTKVERGFASETTGQGVKEFSPRNGGDSAKSGQLLAPAAGSQFLNTIGPRVPLAKPRSLVDLD